MPSPAGRIIFSLSYRQAELLVHLATGMPVNPTAAIIGRADSRAVNSLIKRRLVWRDAATTALYLTPAGDEAAAVAVRLVLS